jgi:hypothetical protein
MTIQNPISKEFENKFKLPKWLINDLQKTEYPDCSDEFNHDVYNLCFLSQERNNMNDSEKAELDYLNSEFFRLTKPIPDEQSGLKFNNKIEQLYFCRVPINFDKKAW